MTEYIHILDAILRGGLSSIEAKPNCLKRTSQAQKNPDLDPTLHQMFYDNKILYYPVLNNPDLE